MSKISFSFIIPLFNRPLEIVELLESMTCQDEKDFDVIIVEDGSTETSEKVIEPFKQKLRVHYYFKENSGPGLSRNYGCQKSKSNYYIVLDSDCILPPHYFKTVKRELQENFTDVFGGPDKAHNTFTNLQKAINYSMTSFLTTGGIRGGGENMDKFHPRSFNMGFSKDVFEKTKGFSNMRFGEDIDLSIRIIKNNFKTRLFKDAYVFHKRRSTIKQFFKQIFNSGIARIQLYLKYPFSLKFVHLLPVVFLFYFVSSIFLTYFFSIYLLFPILFHMLLLFMDSTFKNRSLIIGFYSVLTSYVQLFSYGLGFLIAFWKSIIFNTGSFSAFEKTFYK